MSGHDDEEDTDGQEWRWAHILWQRHGLRMEEFDKMPDRTKLFYIASEMCEISDPCRTDINILLAMNKRGVRL